MLSFVFVQQLELEYEPELEYEKLTNVMLVVMSVQMISEAAR